MAYDPSILSKIGQMGPNIAGAMQDAYTLKNVMDTSQLNQMKLNEEKQAAADTNTLRSMAGKYDLSNPEGQSRFFSEAVKVNPSMAMKLQREFTEMQTGKAKYDDAQRSLWEHQNTIMVSALQPFLEQGMAMEAKGLSIPEIDAALHTPAMQTLEQLKTQKLPNGQPLLKPEDLQKAATLLGGNNILGGIRQLYSLTEKNAERLHQMKQEQLAGRKEATAEAGLTERERHDRAMEGLAVQRMGAGAGKLKVPAGYMLSEDGESVVPIPGGPKDPKSPMPASGRENVLFSRVTGAANEAVAALQNIVELPIGASTGFMGLGATPGHGIMSSVKGALTNKLADQDVQDYNSMLAGVKRNLATIETAGLAPSGALTEGFGSLELRAGDTELTKMRKLAEIRQVIEKGMEINLDDPRRPAEQKTLVKKIIDQAIEAVPFTQHDVTVLEREQRNNPNATMQDVMEKRGLKPKKPTSAPPSTGGAPPPASPSGGAGAGPSKKWKMVGGKLVEDK